MHFIQSLQLHCLDLKYSSDLLNSLEKLGVSSEIRFPIFSPTPVGYITYLVPFYTAVHGCTGRAEQLERE